MTRNPTTDRWARRRGNGPGLWPAAGPVALLVLLAVGALGSGPVAGDAPIAAALAPAVVGGSCNPPNSAPSSLYTPLPNPTTSLRANGSVSVTVQVAAVNYTASLNGTSIYLPTIVAGFPLTPSGSATLSLPPKTLTLAGASWSTAASESKTKVFPSGATFSPNANAFLSTAQLAVMTSVPYGTVQVEFRWQWTVVPAPSGNATSSAWSVPSSTATSPWRATIFAPAPYVAVAHTDPQPAAPGSNYTVGLTGAVANTSFRVVVEHANNGTEITSNWENAPPGTTLFNATAPTSYADSTPLRSGTYLLHVHDRCQAILRSLTLKVSTGAAPMPLGGSAGAWSAGSSYVVARPAAIAGGPTG